MVSDPLGRSKQAIREMYVIVADADAVKIFGETSNALCLTTDSVEGMVSDETSGMAKIVLGFLPFPSFLEMHW